MQTTNVFSRNLFALRDPRKRIALNQGGTSSSKTFSIIQLIVQIMKNVPDFGLFSIVSESMPHLKRGALRDFMIIMGDSYTDNCFNRTDHFYTFPETKNVLELFSADQSSKCRGGRRRGLFINECNNVPKTTFDELEVRTELFTFLDYNPIEDFWGTEMRDYPEVQYIRSTYLDAKNVLPDAIVQKIEARKDRDPMWWRVYGLGEIGSLEGLVYPHFSTIDCFPVLHKFKKVYGIDFGYTNDPTVITENWITEGTIYSDEICYQTDLKNNQIAKILEENGVKRDYDEIFCDAAEPKSRDEIAAYGFNIKSRPGGKDADVQHGIQLVNQYAQVWTKRSVNCIKEQRNFMYVKDKNGKPTNKPSDSGFDHGMDSRRYAIVGKLLDSTGYDLAALCDIG